MRNKQSPDWDVLVFLLKFTRLSTLKTLNINSYNYRVEYSYLILFKQFMLRKAASIIWWWKCFKLCWQDVRHYRKCFDHNQRNQKNNEHLSFRNFFRNFFGTILDMSGTKTKPHGLSANEIRSTPLKNVTFVCHLKYVTFHPYWTSLFLKIRTHNEKLKFPKTIKIYW